MTLRKSNLFSEAVAYTALNSIEKAIPFLILPVLTRTLSKEEIGVYIIFQTVIEILMPLMSLNIDSTILLNYYKLDKEKFREYISSGLVSFVVFFFFSLVVVLSIYTTFLDDYFINPGWMFIICLVIFCRFFTQLRQNLWRTTHNVKMYSILTLGISILKNGLGIYLALEQEMGWKGLILGHLFGYTVFAFASIFSLSKMTNKIFDLKREHIKDLFFVGYPVALHRIGLFMSNAANKFIVAAVLGTAAAGNFGIGATFAAVITVFEDAFSKAFTPHLFAKLKESNNIEKTKIVKISYTVYFALMFLTTCSLTVGFFGVELIYGTEYANTRTFMIPLMLAAMVKGFYKLHVNYIFFSKKTLAITKITITTGLANIALSYFMTVKFGLLGTAYSLLIVNLLQYALSFYTGNVLLPMPWLFFLKKV